MDAQHEMATEALPEEVLLGLCTAIYTPHAILVSPGFPVGAYPTLFGLPVRVLEPMPAPPPADPPHAPRRRRHGQARRFFWERGR